jgi:hypothetical protein
VTRNKLNSIVWLIGVPLLVLVSATSCGETAEASEGDVYVGNGWKVNTDDGIESIDPSRTYLVTWDSSQARDSLSQLFESSVSQLRSYGIDAHLTSTVETVPETVSCPPKNHIVVGLKHRPTDVPGMSQGLACYAMSDRSVFSSKIWINSEYKQLGGSWYMSDKVWKNTTAHELGHAFGLDHPNTPVPTNSYGDTPVMTQPNGGYDGGGKGKFTGWDKAGLLQLVANHG